MLGTGNSVRTKIKDKGFHTRHRKGELHSERKVPGGIQSLKKRTNNSGALRVKGSPRS